MADFAEGLVVPGYEPLTTAISGVTPDEWWEADNITPIATGLSFGAGQTEGVPSIGIPAGYKPAGYGVWV